MKNKIQSRNARFVTLVRTRVMERSNRKTPSESIIQAVAADAACPYYVSFNAAYRNVSKYIRGVAVPTTNRQHMYADMARHVKRLRKRNPRLSYSEAIFHVLEKIPSRGLYLSPGYAVRLFYRANRHNQ